MSLRSLRRWLLPQLLCLSRLLRLPRLLRPLHSRRLWRLSLLRWLRMPPLLLRLLLPRLLLRVGLPVLQLLLLWSRPPCLVLRLLPPGPCLTRLLRWPRSLHLLRLLRLQCVVELPGDGSAPPHCGARLAGTAHHGTVPPCGARLAGGANVSWPEPGRREKGARSTVARPLRLGGPAPRRLVRLDQPRLAGTASRERPLRLGAASSSDIVVRTTPSSGSRGAAPLCSLGLTCRASLARRLGGPVGWIAGRHRLKLRHGGVAIVVDRRDARVTEDAD